jgi:hypothetical protein
MRHGNKGQPEYRSELIYHLGQMAGIIKTGGFNDGFFESASGHLHIISERLQLSNIQSSLFSLILNESAESEGLTLASLAKNLHCENIAALSYIADIKQLERRHLVKRVDLTIKEGWAWRVPESVCLGLAENKLPKVKSIKNLPPEKFFEVMHRAIDRYRQNKKRWRCIIVNNMHLSVCREVRNLEPVDALLLLYFCCELLVNGSAIIDEIEITQFLRKFPYSNRNAVICKLRGSKHPLVEKDFIEFAGHGLFGASAAYSLTGKARQELLEGLEVYETDSENKKDCIPWQDIRMNELFYNPAEQKRITELSALFADENYKTVRQRLSDRRRAPAFTCFFYGPPGTGKTASVYQIARASQRDIVQVNIAETKSMWFGKSEKIIKGIFDDYRKTVQRRSLKGIPAPILFFNEADAVFSKRMSLGSERAGPAQTENAIQNILLDEIEKLDGILIATTNLNANFDAAFERRFLYKVEFTKPDAVIRSAIWNSLVPELEKSSCAVLADKFNFSGGQIDNIARKADINFILNGEKPSVSSLEKYCYDELLEKQQRRIGFCV